MSTPAPDVADVCLVCGTPDPIPVVTIDSPPAGEKDYGIPPGRYRRTISRCRECGAYLNPAGLIPADYYTGGYNEATYAGEMLRSFTRIRSLPPEQSDNKQRARRIAAHLTERHLTPAETRILDVGSGLCVFLAELAPLGYSCWCVDPDPRAVAHAREHAGVAGGHAGTLDTFAPGEGFDLVTFNKVLEHVPDPARLLRQARALLRPGGAIYVELPDADLALRHGTAADRQEFFAEHLAVYNRSSLERLAAGADLVAADVTSLHEPSGKCTIFAFLRPAE